MKLRDYAAHLRNDVFSRRAFIILVAKVSVAVILICRLFFLQISRFSEYRTLSDKNRIKYLLIEPVRGLILDRKGISLAENRPNYKLYIYKQRNYPIEETLAIVFRLMKISPAARKDVVQELQSNGYVYPVLIKDQLSWAEVVLIEENKHKLGGVYVDKGYLRYYPFKEMFGHVLGYMGMPRKEEVSRYRLFNAGSLKIGKAGIEKIANQQLIGQFGSKQVEVNASRVIVREIAYNRSTGGENIELTLDAKLQQYIYNMLPRTGASVIVQCIDNGEVLAMLSSPAFDPNIFSGRSLNADTWSHLSSKRSNPLTNRTINKLYPPGSVWKIVMALAILDHGINPEEKVLCRGGYQLGNRFYKCWHKEGHGHVNLSDALMMSCNVYFYDMSLRIGISQIHKMAKSLGFGEKIGIDLLGESKGSNPDKDWKMEQYGDQWMAGDTLNASIGQGFISVTPIQIITMMARVASGQKVSPHVLKRDDYSNNTEKLMVNPDHLNIVRKALWRLFYDPKGVGYSKRILDPKYVIAGKTGTAQTVSRDTSDLSVNLHQNIKCHALFTGFAPFDNPKYATVVVVDNVGWGSQNALPIGRDILKYVQEHC